MPLKSSCPCVQGDVFTVFIAVSFVTAKKKEINVSVRQQEDRCEHTHVHAHARILYSTENECFMATCINVKQLRIMILGIHCKLCKCHLYEVLKHSKPQCILLRHVYIHSWQT